MLEHTTSLKKRLLPCLILAVLALLLSRTAGAQAATVQPNCGSWSFVKSPNAPPTSNDELLGVSAVSATDVWAVGNFTNSRIGRSRMTLIEQWNGTSWSVVPSANPSTSQNSLLGVTQVPGTNQAWAVGTYTHHLDKTLTEFYC